MDSQALGEGKATSETVCNASSCTAAILSVHVRFGSKADMCSAKRHVRFTPNSDIDCVFQHVCFGPKADISVRSASL